MNEGETALAAHLFLAVDALDPGAGPSTPNIFEAELNAAMIQSAQEVTMVTDSSKIGRSSLSLIAPITSVNRVITGGGISPLHKRVFGSNSVEVVVVPGLAGVAG